MTKCIPLTRGFVALVDDVDYSTLAPFKWHLASQRCAAAHVPVSGQQRRLYMHRLLLNAQRGQVVDHIDGNPLNNTRANLRLVTRSQNQWNRRRQRNASGYKGVAWHRKRQKYYARIQVHGRRYCLGYFDMAEEAAAAYDAAAEQLHGPHAWHNGSEVEAAAAR